LEDMVCSFDYEISMIKQDKWYVKKQ